MVDTRVGQKAELLVVSKVDQSVDWMADSMVGQMVGLMVLELVERMADKKEHSTVVKSVLQWADCLVAQTAVHLVV